MIKTKFIFLDIDGVIATDRMFNGNAFDIETIRMPYEWDKECCACLDLILNITNAKIVLTSDWRFHYTFDEIKTIMTYYQIDHTHLIGFTDNIRLSMSHYENNRVGEIHKYLDINKIHDNKYCIIDDMNLDIKNFVHIKDTYKGLNNPEITEQIYNLLK